MRIIKIKSDIELTSILITRPWTFLFKIFITSGLLYILYNSLERNIEIVIKKETNTHSHEIYRLISGKRPGGDLKLKFRHLQKGQDGRQPRLHRPEV